MPTVPVIFNYEYNPGAFSSIATPPLNWRLQATYADGSGVLQTIIRTRYADGTDLSPFSFDVDLTAITAPPGGYPDSDDETYLEANLTYPADVTNVTLLLDLHIGGHYGLRCHYTGPVAWPWFVQPERESEELPSVEPYPLQFTLEHPTQPGGLTFTNRSLSELAISGNVIVDYGDGSSGAQLFAYTLPAGTLDVNMYSNGILWSEITRTPVLQIVTDDSLSTPAEPEIIADTATDYLVEIRLPRFTHDYTTTNNPNPAVRAQSNAGNCYPQELDPMPVANFTGADDSDTGELDAMQLDGSKSFDLTDVVNIWFWIISPGDMAEESLPGFGQFSAITYTPVLNYSEDLDEGDYWVSLWAGNDGAPRINQTPAYRVRQVSQPRRKRVSIGGNTGLIYDEKRLTLWRLYGAGGNCYVERHLQHEAPTNDGVLVGPGSPGSITRAGAHLFVTTRSGDLYTSPDESNTWSFVMALADDVSLIAKCAEPNGSAIYHLVKAADGTLQRIVVRRSGGGWVVSEPEAVTGLPESTRRPGAADISGATIALTAKSDDGVFMATSTDHMLTWTVNA